MNQGRFDDLTRALATTQLSRWQVLKTLSATVVLGILPPLGGKRTAAAQDLKECIAQCSPWDPNKLTGSCQCFFNYADRTGVYLDPPGRRIRDSGATSEGAFWARATRSTPRKVSQECRVCRTINPPSGCDPVSCTNLDLREYPTKRYVCIDAVYKTEITPQHNMGRLTWEPNPPPCDEPLCAIALRDFYSIVDRHEQGHLEIFLEKVQFFNNAYEAVRMTGCGKTLSDAEKDAEQKMEEEAHRGYVVFAKDYEAASNAWDEQDAKNKDLLRKELCHRCAPCPIFQAQGATQTSQLCEDPGGGGNCDSPCGPCETCQNGTCVPKTCPDGQSCDPSTGLCAGGGNCDPPCEPCETCQDGACVPKTCEPPMVIHPNICECILCPEDTEPCGDGFVCCPLCPEGEERCGHGFACCAPERCDPATGQCAGGDFCYPPCIEFLCEKCENGTCVGPICEWPKTRLDPITCECECPFPNCFADEIWNPDTCHCDCPPGKETCGVRPNDYCADLQTDANNCGTCGNRCSDNVFNTVCVNGACICPEPSRVCSARDGSGQFCVDITGHPNHCGDCYKDCPINTFCVPDGKGGGRCACSNGGRCLSFPRCNDNPDCVCLINAESPRGGICVDNTRVVTPCAERQRCDGHFDCPTGHECAIHTCCGAAGICVLPEELCPLAAIGAAQAVQSQTVEGQQSGGDLGQGGPTPTSR